MSEYKDYTVKESRIRELARQCPEYAKAMKVLFPEALKEEPHYITDGIEAEVGHSEGINGEMDIIIRLLHHGEQIGAVLNRGIEITDETQYAIYIEEGLKYWFQIIKK